MVRPEDAAVPLFSSAVLATLLTVAIGAITYFFVRKDGPPEWLRIERKDFTPRNLARGFRELLGLEEEKP